MKAYSKSFPIAMVLAICVATVASQDEEPQLRQYLAGRANPHASLERAFNAMYDLDFAHADAETAQFITEHPDDPTGPAVQAASVLFAIFERHKVLQSQLFASDENYRKRDAIVPDNLSVQQFESALRQAEGQARKALSNNSANQEALFALTLVHGLRADYAALIERHDFAALRFSNAGTAWARKLLASSPEAYDAYVAIGIQKYLVSLRSAPVRWMLRLGGINGDQGQALEELQMAADKGRYLGPFARTLLTVAYLRSNHKMEALQLLAGLHQQFPHNPLFSQEIDRIEQSESGQPAAGGSFEAQQ